jgi:hypothetical protein
MLQIRIQARLHVSGTRMDQNVDQYRDETGDI